MSDESRRPPPARRAVLEDLLDDLIWPTLLRAPGLALRPAHVGLAFFTLALVGVLDAGVARAVGGSARPLTAIAVEASAGGWSLAMEGLGRGSASGVIAGATAGFFGPFEALAREAPARALALAVPVLLVLVVGGGAIARMSACEFALARAIPWTQGLGFALGKARGLLAAVLGPLVLVTLLAVVLMAAGGVLLRWPVVDVLGAALFGLALLVSLGTCVILLGYALGLSMFVPALACEGSDAIDAVQRGYAYALGRPLRLVGYGLVLIVLGVVTHALVSFFVVIVTTTALELVTAWAGEHGRTVTDPESGGLAGRVLGFWLGAAGLVGPAYALSYFFCGSTLLYLVMRRVADGQDYEDLFEPGSIRRTVELSLAARGEAAGAVRRAPAETARDGADDEG